MSVSFKPPKSLAACVDLLYKIRQERLAKDKEAAALKEKETALSEHLINNLPKSEASGIAGKVARVSIETKQIVTVTDWDKLYDYVVKNKKKGAFALLQRRVSDSAVKEIWQAGKPVPGCSPFNVPVISLTKR